MYLLTLLWFVAVLCCSSADYTCVCSLVELPVFSKADTSSAVIGSLHKSYCTPVYGQVNEYGDFQSIQFKEQIGYVESHSMVVRTCLDALPSIVSGTKTTLLSLFSATTTSQRTVPIAVFTATSPVTPFKTNLMTEASKTMTTSEIFKTTTTVSSEKTTATNLMTSSIVRPKETTNHQIVSSIAPTNRSTSHMSSSSTSTTTTQEPSTTTTQPEKVLHCPDDWTRHNESCYRFMIDQKESQSDAIDECEKLDSHLVLVNSKSEQNYLANYLSGIWSYVHDHDDEVWILGTDHEDEGIWMYTDKESDTDVPLPYTDWALHQPDDSHGKHEDCVALNRDSNYEWHDFNCHNHYHYICERPAYSTSGMSLIG